MKVRAALLDRDLSLAIGEREIEPLAPETVLVKVAWAGLCGSDLHAMRSGEWITDWPATPGHEVFGHVEAVGEGVAIEPGTPVVLDSRLPCLACERCAEDPDLCAQISFLGESRPGGFASHLAVPLRSVHPVSPELQGEDAVLAEPLALAFHALSHLGRAPRTALILGHGPVGALLHIELTRRYPEVEVTVVEPAAQRAEFARALGADCVRQFASLFGSRFELVVDAAGYPRALGDALGAAAEEGVVLAVAIGGREATVDARAMVERRLSVHGINAFVHELPEAIEALRREPWRYRPVVTDTVTLAELPAAIEAAVDPPRAIKVLVRP